MSIGKLYKIKLLKAAFFWSLIFVFISPQFVQFIHLFDDNDHEHHEMHQAQALNFHDHSDSCGIFSFEFSSFQKDILIKSFQVMILELFQQNVCIENETLACPTFLLPLLRGPPF